jgi:hypothetical protein
VLIVAQSAAGWHGHDGPSASAACESCGLETSPITEGIVRLQKSPRWQSREHASHDLRKVDWRRHPEVLGALAYSLLHDPEEEVREESAESLSKMGACVPVVHEALARAASLDPDGATRREARRGLRKLSRHCEAPCKVCGTEVITTRPALPGPLDVFPPLDLAPVPSELAPLPPTPIDSSVSPPPPPSEIVPLTPLPGEARPDADGLKPIGDPEDEPGRRPVTRAVPARRRVARSETAILQDRPAR